MNLLSFLFAMLSSMVSSRGRLFKEFIVIKKSRIFDRDYYAKFLPEAERWWVRRLGIFHYLLIGERQDFLPNPLFMVDYYRGQLNLAPEGSLLSHYICFGSFSALRPNPFFSGLFYVDSYHDVLATAQHPLAHYYWHGWKEGRNPHAAFNTREYAKKHGIDLNGSLCPLEAYLKEECAKPTELWNLSPGQPLQRAQKEVKPTSGELSIDLIIPVYRRPDLVENLFDSLSNSPDWYRVQKCVVVDDCGDSFTTKYLQELAKRSPKIILIKNETNLGFLRGVNKAYDQTSADVVILVNSDVQVPKGWLNRLVAPLEQDSKIALATPLATSGANLSVTLRPGQSWLDADEVIAGHQPKYPDACTGIGYLMAIRRSAITTQTLFDDIFQHGYGEDTDLHYRLITSGWRSVVCDNLMILHKGSASYLLDDQKSKIYDQNRKIFFERWGKLHQDRHEEYIRSNALAHVLTQSGHTCQEFIDDDIDVLFIAPTNNRAIGGVKIIFEMASYLCEHGVRAKIFCTDQTAPISDHFHDSLMPIFREKTLLQLVKSVKIVVGTGIGVAGFTSQMKNHYHAKCWWLVQGPECYFGVGEHYQRFKDEVLSADHVITVSQYLTNLVKDFGVTSITTLPLGPDHLAFYPRDVNRDSKSLAIHLIDTPDKGARFAISFAEEAKRQGMNVHFFGSSRLTEIVSKDLGTFHGKLDSDGLAKLFSRCQFYLDLSFMEGLGLLPLEAAMCGCVPVMTKKGAPDLIFGEGNGVVWLESHMQYTSLGRDLASTVTRSRGSFEALFNSRQAKLILVEVIQGRH